jgi:BT1 family
MRKISMMVNLFLVMASTVTGAFLVEAGQRMGCHRAPDCPANVCLLLLYLDPGTSGRFAGNRWVYVGNGNQRRSCSDSRSNRLRFPDRNFDDGGWNTGLSFLPNLDPGNFIAEWFFFGIAEVAILDLAARATPKGCEGLGYSLMVSFSNVAQFGADIVGSYLADHNWSICQPRLSECRTTAIVLLLLPLLPAALLRSTDTAGQPAPAC